MDIALTYYKIFDKEFYLKNYPHFDKDSSKNELFSHWLQNGKKFNYIINKQQAIQRFEIGLNHSKELIKMVDVNPNNNIIFNILIRTSSRPEYFKKCIDSILGQNFKGDINIFVSYDNEETYDYLKKYLHVIKAFKMESNQDYGFNLYCNNLLQKVESGWIIILDDDDQFLSNRALEIISSYIKKENQLIIWNFLRPDRIVRPKEEFVFSEIDTTCFCFNNSYKNKASWIAERGSDFHFFSNLGKKRNLEKKFLNLVLTRTIYDDRIANYGN
jgi:hypothetical protein